MTFGACLQLGRRARRTCLLGVGVALAVVAVAPPAAVAQPAPAPSAPAEAPPAPAAGDVSLALSDLGMGSALTFPGQQFERSIALPLLPGMAPTALTGTIQLPPHVARGTLEVHSGTRLLDRVEVPQDPRAPVRLSLAGAEQENNAISVTLTSSLVSEPGTCVTDWLGRPMTLSDAAVGYFGAEAQPSTVAEFLPPVLRQLTVYVPATPSETESAAVLTLTTALIARYHGQPLAVDVRPVQAGAAVPDHAPGLLERQIEIAESPEAGLRVTAGAQPVLRITGNGSALDDQIRLLTSALTKIAITSGATAVALPQAPQLAPDSTTLLALGETQLSATAIGSVSVDIGIDQTRLGRASRDVRIRLLGNYTPLPSTLSGNITVTAGSRYVDSWPVDASGRIERWIDLPDEVLGRYTTLTVTFHQTGLTHGCGLEQPVTLTIDPDSEVTSASAAPPVPGGFGALPQALLPGFQVGLRTPGFTDTLRAVKILTGLQRLTAVPLRPELVGFDAAARGKQPAVLITATGDLPESIRLPLSQDDDTLTVTDDSTRAAVRIDPTVPFGSLQTTWSGGRTVVVATSTEAPEHLDRALDWLNADSRRWYRLSGSVLFQTGDREPEFFDPSAVAPSATGASISSDSVARMLAIAAGVLLVVGVLVAAVVLLMLRRRRR